MFNWHEDVEDSQKWLSHKNKNSLDISPFVRLTFRAAHPKTNLLRGKP
jgi:hypothetical protein